jgi:hypothetical protein
MSFTLSEILGGKKLLGKKSLKTEMVREVTARSGVYKRKKKAGNSQSNQRLS